MMPWSLSQMAPTRRYSPLSRSLSWLDRVLTCSPDRLWVLMYHRVDHPGTHPTLDPRLISATPEAFEQQMQYVSAHQHAVTMAEVLESCRTGSSLPSRSVLITFDDAYCDFAENAWPILKRHRLPATL